MNRTKDGLGTPFAPRGDLENQVDQLLDARALIDESLRHHKDPLTILFTDLVGSTAYFDRYGDTAGFLLIHRHTDLISSIVVQFEGRVIKTIGDSVMADFPNPLAGTRAAIEIQTQIAESNRLQAERDRLYVRIGINYGVGFRYGQDVYGDAVNVAARIAKSCGAAQILVSRSVHEAVAADAEVRCTWVGKTAFHGKAQADDLFEVLWLRETVMPAGKKATTSASSSAPASDNGTSHLQRFRNSLGTRYELLEQVGAGGMGIVYQAIDRATDETIALKLLRSEISSPDSVARLINELKLSRRVTHKNVCRIYDFVATGNVSFISMEFVAGESLRKALDRFGAFNVRKGIEVAAQICAGLREAHLQGIVHRDLKPENLMIDVAGNVKIMDFGLAKSVTATHATTSIIGTPAYMSPEQLEGKPADPRSDIYSLGLVLYEVFTGRLCFAADTPAAILHKQLTEVPVPPRAIDAAIPAKINDAILRSLAKKPDGRFQTVAELEAALLGVPIDALPATPGPSRRASARWTFHPSRIKVTAAALGVAAALMGLFFVFGSGRRTPPRAIPQAITVAQESASAAVPQMRNDSQLFASNPLAAGPEPKNIVRDHVSSTVPRKMPEIAFIKIPAGEFLMGCTGQGDPCYGTELPAHLVRITKEFELGKYEVTQAQWTAVMGNNPSQFKDPNGPVESVDWKDVTEFLKRLNARHDGYSYRLPTEAEWEYAAKAGGRVSDPRTLPQTAWYAANSEQHTHRAGQLAPNAWGLYDILGNVWEWVQDWYGESYYKESTSVDPKGPPDGHYRVIRGRSWWNDAGDTRPWVRSFAAPSVRSNQLGFRCARVKDLSVR